MNVTASRTDPGEYSLDAHTVERGMTIECRPSAGLAAFTMQIVGEPRHVLRNCYEARVRVIGGHDDGHEFSASLYTR